MYRKIRCDGYCSTFLEFGVELNTRSVIVCQRDLGDCLHSLIIKNVSYEIYIPGLGVGLPEIRHSGRHWRLGDRKQHVVMNSVP